MDKFFICDICMEVYDGGLRCPRIFNCGHSFCSSCIQKLLKTCSICPTCKMPVDNETLESISINYILKQMVEEYSFEGDNESSSRVVKEDRECKAQHQVESLLSKGFCKIHKMYKHFRCMTCSMWICSKCVVISHKLCKTLLVKEAIEEIKENKIKIRKCLATISERKVDSLNVLDFCKVILGVKKVELQCYQQKIIALKKDIYEVNCNIEEIEELQANLTPIKYMLEDYMKGKNVATSANDLEYLEEKMTEHFTFLQEVVENLKFSKSSMLQNVENDNKDIFDYKKKLVASVTAGEKILVTANEDSITRYGELDFNKRIFRIHFMQQIPHPPLSVCVPLENCLTTMTGTAEWPGKIFLQFSSNDDLLGDVIIRLYKTAQVATETVLRMCLFGEGGKSFVGEEMTDLNYVRECISSKRLLPFPSDVANGTLQMETKHRKIGKEGEMCLEAWCGKNNSQFHLWIFAAGSNWEWELIPTGQVEKGIQVIKDAYQRIGKGETVKIVNCGWVLS